MRLSFLSIIYTILKYNAGICHPFCIMIDHMKAMGIQFEIFYWLSPLVVFAKLYTLQKPLLRYKDVKRYTYISLKQYKCYAFHAMI